MNVYLNKRKLKIMHYSQLIAMLAILTAIPYTPSYAETREECRASKDYEQIILCVEQNIYDPCDDAGGSWGRAQCASAHAEIAERKIRKAEEEIYERLSKGDAEQDALLEFKNSQEYWRKFRDSYCNFTNHADDLPQFSSSTFFHSGFCLRRLNEQRAEELETILLRNE